MESHDSEAKRKHHQSNREKLKSLQVFACANDFAFPRYVAIFRTDTWLRLRRVQLAEGYLPRRSGAAERGPRSPHLTAQAASTACPKSIPLWPSQHISQFRK
jgi:hypothetical protein